MSSIGANYAQLQVMQKKAKEKMMEKMMKKRLEKERDGGADGVSSAAAGKSGNRIFPVKSSPSSTYEQVGRQE